MSFIPQTVCRRCKREYSVLRSRCPHCGTRKTSQSERTPVSSSATKPGTSASNRRDANSQWQMLFGLILVAAVIIAVIVIIVVSTKEPKEEPLPEPTPPVETVAPTPPPTPSPPPTAEIVSITISYYNSPRTEFSAHIGDQVPLNATIYPLDAGATVTWRSTDESVVTVDSDGLVTAVGSGNATIIAECNGVQAECKVGIW